jgi:hypothetical protein
MRPDYPSSRGATEAIVGDANLLCPSACHGARFGDTNHLVNTPPPISWSTFAPFDTENGSMSRARYHRKQALSTKQGDGHALRAF